MFEDKEIKGEKDCPITNISSKNDDALIQGTKEKIDDIKSEVTERINDVNMDDKHINANKRKLFLKNISKNKKETDIKRFALYLTKVNAVSCNLHDESSGTWLVNFESNIG